MPCIIFITVVFIQTISSSKGCSQFSDIISPLGGVGVKM